MVASEKDSHTPTVHTKCHLSGSVGRGRKAVQPLMATGCSVWVTLRAFVYRVLENKVLRSEHDDVWGRYLRRLCDLWKFGL